VKTKAFALAALLVGVALSWAAQVPAPKPVARAQSAVEKELEKLEAEWAAAVATNDPNKIGAFFTEDFLFVGAGGVLQDRKQHLDDFATGKLKVQSVKLKASTIHVYQNAAVVSIRVDVKGEYAGRDVSGPYQFTDTWAKQGKHWLAAARQQTAVAKPKAGGK
jgi:uncharacterized protein (TIGR02246 family)